jgi:hypothetical protein
MLNVRFSRTSTLVAAASAALVALSSSGASAQEAAGAADPVSGDGKGIVGGALLGAEVVTITMGVAGVEDAWPYFVFGGVGAVGGALGGFAVESADPPAEAPLFMLAGGLTLIVPALVISLNATSADDPIEDADFPDEPAAEPAAPEPPGTTPAGGGSFGVEVQTRRSTPTSRATIARRSTPAPGAPRRTAVDLRGGDLALGVPAVQVAPLYSSEEMARYGVSQGAEVRVPVLGATF